MVKSQSKKSRRARVAARRARRQGVKQSREQVVLSQCTQHYAEALTDPFGAWTNKLTGVCVPDSYVLPSTKASYFARASGATGTNGYGMVMFNPYKPATDAAALTASTSANTATAASSLSAYTSVSTNWADPPYSSADYGTDLMVRVVAAGLRWRFNGTNLNKGGVIVKFRQQMNNTVSTYTYNSARSESSAVVESVGGGWHQLTWKPSSPGDFDFTDLPPTKFPMAIVVQSAANAQPFEAEAFAFYEFVGRSAGGTSASHSDPVGFAAVQEVAANNPQGRGDILREVADAVRSTASYVRQHGGAFVSDVQAIAQGAKYVGLL